MTLDTFKWCVVIGCKCVAETTTATTGMSFAMTQEWRSRLLRPRLVREDVYIQRLEPDDVEMIREALGKGLTPSRFSVVENALILRFELGED